MYKSKRNIGNTNFSKGACQHVVGKDLPSTFTNQTVYQPIETEVFGEDILL